MTFTCLHSIPASDGQTDRQTDGRTDGAVAKSRFNETVNVGVRQVKIWFQNRRSKYKKLLKQFGLSAGRGLPSGAVMESTVTSDLPEYAGALDVGRIKSSPKSFDDNPDVNESSAAAATSTTTDEMSTIEFGVSCAATVMRPPGVGLASTCWTPPPPPPASIDNSQHYLAATYDLTSCMTAATYSTPHDFVSMARTTCYQPWCLSAEHCHHNLFT